MHSGCQLLCWAASLSCPDSNTQFKYQIYEGRTPLLLLAVGRCLPIDAGLSVLMHLDAKLLGCQWGFLQSHIKKAHGRRGLVPAPGSCSHISSHVASLEGCEAMLAQNLVDSFGERNARGPPKTRGTPSVVCSFRGMHSGCQLRCWAASLSCPDHCTISAHGWPI